MHLLASVGYTRVPWKNGGGITHEIARSAASAVPSWRLSVATIERDGPFSDFSGYDRTIVPIAGEGFVLTIDGEREVRLDRLFEPFSFAGESHVACALVRGTSRDFNVMTRRGAYVQRVRAVALVDRPLLLQGTFVFVAAGMAEATAGGACVRASQGDTLALAEDDRPALRALSPNTKVLHVTLERRAPCNSHPT